MIPAALAPLAAHLWQSTLFAALAGLLALVLRRNQARVRYWLWLAASYKFLLPFSWLVSVGHQFEWRSAPAIVPPAFSAVTDMVGGPIFLASFPAGKPAPDHLPALLSAIWAIWACGFVVVVAGWAREWLRLRAIVRAASPLSLSLPIRIVSTSARLEPGVFGIFRPVLLLPAGIAGRLTQAQLQAILAHELCHVRRRDNLTAAVHMLVEALFWFYPLLWWLGARLIDEREAACDEDVLQSGSQSQVYAESILKVCEFYLESPLTCMSGVTGSDLKKRMQRIMKEHLGLALSTRKKFLLATAGVVALALPVVAGVLAASRLPAVSDWQTAAGGKMAFDVASVKRNMAGPSATVSGNVLFTADDLFTPTGGLYSEANSPLISYLMFAYKMRLYQLRILRAQLPKWTNGARYDIQARASGNPTKDQYRLMMLALLADRFKLVAHYETRQAPVFALVLDRPGKLGPQLRPHPADAPCSTEYSPATGAPATVAGWFPEVCGGILGGPSPSNLGRRRGGARNVPMAVIVDSFGVVATGVDLPVLDKTGLTGKFDFTIEWTPQPNDLPPGLDFQPDPAGPTFIEALKEQLGLKLVPQIGPIEVLVIDHIEEPSPN